jgi:hypothetical protein
MIRSIAILLALVVCASAAETRSFYGTWPPPRSLLRFWQPIDDSWWKEGSTPKLDRRSREFAAQSRPEVIIPDMIRDLRAHPSEVRWFVYLGVMSHWPKKTVLRILASFQQSADPAVRHIADEFYADIE